MTFFQLNEFYLLYQSFNKSLLLFNLPTFIKSPLLDNYLNFKESSEIYRIFNFRRASTIKSFFNLQLVDIPLCFKKSLSLYFSSYEVPFLKLQNILMRSGNRQKILKNLTSTLLRNPYGSLNTTNLDSYTSWTKLFITFEFYWASFNSLSYLSLGKPQSVYHVRSSVYYNLRHYSFLEKNSIKPVIWAQLKKYSPVFNFYIRKVDKSIRKNTRGKGSKYKVIWKYVPAYKRPYIAARWLLKELKFQKNPLFGERLRKVFETFLINTANSFLLKLRKFVHFFVFFNHRTSLMKHLRSTS